MRMKLSSGLLLTLALIGGHLYAGNILSNPGFESGALAPWAVGRNYCFTGTCDAWSVTDVTAHSGIFSVVDIGNIELVQTFAPIPASEILSLSWWGYGGDRAYDFFYSDGTDVEFVSSVPGGGWEFVDATANLDAGKSLVGFSVWGAGPNATTYLDDFALDTSVPESGTYSLAASCLLGLALLRRKVRT